MDYNLDNYAKAELDYLTKRLNKRDANLLEIRGIAGDGFDKNLGRIPPICYLAALPLPIVNGSGSPLRAIALVPRSA